MHEQKRISPYNINTESSRQTWENKEENTNKELQVDSVPNPPNWNHEYFMADIKENY